MKGNLLLFALIIIYTYADAQNCITNTSSLLFNSSYVSVDSSGALNISDSITIEAWVNASSWGFSSAQNSIVCKHGWTYGEEGFVLRAGGTGELSFNFACDSAGTPVSWRDNVSTLNVLQLNTWHHVAATFDGMESKIYVDGNVVGTHNFGAQVSIIPSVDYNLKIGKLADDGQFETRYWDGMIDEVRIWHKALTQQEIMQNMNVHLDTTGGIPDLVAYWRFNENTGSTVTDLSGGGHTGTLNGCTWSTDVPFSDGPQVPVISQAPPFLFSSATSGNQWYVDGNLIAGATGTGYQPLQNGSYTVTVTDSNGCSATSNPVIITTLGISEAKPDKLLINSRDINGKLIFALTDADLANSDLKIMDNTGKIVLTLGKGNVTREVPVNLTSGLYILSMKVNADNFIRKVLIH